MNKHHSYVVYLNTISPDIITYHLIFTHALKQYNTIPIG